jgi:hypothetical protein
MRKWVDRYTSEGLSGLQDRRALSGSVDRRLSPRCHRRACHDRQWLVLPNLRLPQALPPARPQAHPHHAYTPKTNGKAERFVQTCLREPACARAYLNDELPFFVHSLQLASPSFQYRCQAAHQQTPAGRE